MSQRILIGLALAAAFACAKGEKGERNVAKPALPPLPAGAPSAEAMAGTVSQLGLVVYPG